MSNNENKDLITLRQYAQDRRISYEAARQSFERYKDAMSENDVIKQGRTRYLTQHAIEVLDNYRDLKAVRVVDSIILDLEEVQTKADDRLKSLKYILSMLIAKTVNDDKKAEEFRLVSMALDYANALKDLNAELNDIIQTELNKHNRTL